MTNGHDYRIGFKPDIVTAPGVRRFHEYWESLRRGRRFPAKADFDVTAVAKLASSLLLLRVFHDPLDFEYRIIGEDIAHRFKNLKGSRVRESALINVGASAYRNYCAVVEAGQPQFLEGWVESIDRSNRRYRLSRVHCPLSPDDKTIDYIVSCVAFAH